MKRYNVIAVVMFVVGLGIASTMEYDAELAQQQKYCNNVENHIVPDYNGNYDEVCK